MSFLSIYAIACFPFVVLLTYIVPTKLRVAWLLAASLLFYGAMHPVLIPALLACCVMTYGFGRVLAVPEPAGLLSSLRSPRVRHASHVGDQRSPSAHSDVEGPRRKALLALSILAHVAILLIAKYGIVVIPGASFFLLQSIGYLIDVYRGDITAEKNFLKLSLFVSFFPYVLSGPIERAGNMLPQFSEPRAFRFENLRDGFFTMLWGYFMKLVVAERCAVIVNAVYDSYYSYNDVQYGTAVFVAIILYTFQIYLDFAGYSCIALGAAKMLGFDIMENFRQPYLVSDITMFWRRWHISLSTWFRDYLYIPLGGNRRGKAQRSLNLLIVFAVSGFWHGADLTFVFWGILHGVYQILGGFVRSEKKKLFSRRLAGCLICFFLVAYAWVLFRADSFTQAAWFIRTSFMWTPWMLTDGTLLSLGLDRADVTLMLLGLLLVFAVDLAKHRGIDVRARIAAQGMWLKVIFAACALVFVVVCGYWGGGYDAGKFIYVQF